MKYLPYEQGKYLNSSIKPGRGKVIRGQSRRIVFQVYCFFKNETEQANRMKNVSKKTSVATGLPLRTVERIIQEGKRSGHNIPVFSTPGKKRRGKKTVTNIDNFTQGVIRRTINDFYEVHNELLTLEKLHKVLKENINFKGSITSLSKILKDLGIQWRKTENNGTINQSDHAIDFVTDEIISVGSDNGDTSSEDESGSEEIEARITHFAGPSTSIEVIDPLSSSASD